MLQGFCELVISIINTYSALIPEAHKEHSSLKIWDKKLGIYGPLSPQRHVPKRNNSDLM